MLTKSLQRLFLTYFLICLVIILCEYGSYYFYPFGIIILAHLYITLALFGHEGTHFLLHPNRKVNTFVARYFCHFPFVISHSHYSYNHLRHHRFLGSEKDPDLILYKYSYPSVRAWLMSEFINIITLRSSLVFIQYFTGIPDWVKNGFKLSYKHDYYPFFIFWILIVSVLSYFDIGKYFLLYWMCPVILAVPWINIFNNFQHFSLDPGQGFSSSNLIFKNKILQEFLFPLNLNFHHTHHSDTQIPYYELSAHPLSQSNKVGFKQKAREVYTGW